ncbi:hypothetical protein LDO31_00200 [Luteimonas sp. XNQY3]|nr:hypothetical protein [Luteimonas sp. XNQY3]
MLRSKIRIAQSDLLAWSAIVENHRQRTLQFPADATAAKQGFQPASKAADFGFTYPAAGGGYPLTATGAGGRLTGCTLTLAADNSRGSKGCPDVGSAAW